MTPNKIEIKVDADEAVDALNDAAGRIRQAHTGRPPTRSEWVLWCVVIMASWVALIAAVVAGERLAVAGWTIALWHAAALGPKWSHR